MSGDLGRFIWIPRTLGILFIVFLSLFALDVWSMDAPFWAKLGGFLMHLIPSFVLVIVLAISWKRPIIGGIIFLIIALLFTISFHTYTHFPTFLTISGIPFVIGLLFVWFRDKTLKV